MKKKVSLVMAAVMAMSMVTACSSGTTDTTSSDTTSTTEKTETSGTGEGVTITVYNSKSEIQSQLEEMADEYYDKTGVKMEVYYSNDTVAAHMATKYASNDPYTIAMVDAKDLYSLAEEHAIDLSDQDWVNDTNYAISIDGKVYGFPTCVEARGLIYNADAIKSITGKDFVPEDYTTLDEFKGLLDELAAGGMESSVGIMKEDWSLGAHYLPQVYEMRDDVDGFIADLHAGNVDLMSDEKFNELMDTFDVLMEHNYAKASAIAAEREVSEQKLAEGEIAFMFGGSWDWSVMSAYDYTENIGMMALPLNTDDGSNTKLLGGGSKYFFIDSSDKTTDEQRQAAKDFLDWLVYDEEGQSFLVNDCNLVPAFSNIELEVADPLGNSVKNYADTGDLISSYNYLPDDHYSLNGASFQKYLAGQLDRQGFAQEIENYWKSTTPVEH